MLRCRLNPRHDWLRSVSQLKTTPRQTGYNIPPPSRQSHAATPALREATAEFWRVKRGRAARLMTIHIQAKQGNGGVRTPSVILSYFNPAWKFRKSMLRCPPMTIVIHNRRRACAT